MASKTVEYGTRNPSGRTPRDPDRHYLKVQKDVGGNIMYESPLADMLDMESISSPGTYMYHKEAFEGPGSKNFDELSCSMADYEAMLKKSADEADTIVGNMTAKGGSTRSIKEDVSSIQTPTHKGLIQSV